MRLHLLRPIVFFDLETTGTHTDTDRIIQMSMMKLTESGADPEVRTFMMNPGVPIPPESSAIHGITDAAVSGLPEFTSFAPEILKFLDGCDLGGYNVIRFDLPVLSAEFGRREIIFPAADVRVVDAQTIFFKKEQRTLAAAMKFYCGRELTDAHDAEADIRATVDVFAAQLERYADLPDDVGALNSFCEFDKVVDPSGKFVLNAEGEIIFNFGGNRGKLAASDPGYLQWMLRGTFSPRTKEVAQQILNKVKKSS